MKKAALVGIVSGLMAAHLACAVDITFFQGNGEITCDNLTTGEYYAIEWTPSMTTQAWANTWDGLDSFQATGSAMKLSVPMFYRVATAKAFVISETFSDANGANNLVDIPRTTALYDEPNTRYIAGTISPSNMTTSVMNGADGNYYNIKTFSNLAARVLTVANEITITTPNPGNYADCYMRFVYENGTTADSGVNGSWPWQAFTYTNPIPDRVVSNIQVWLRGRFAVAPAYQVMERNTTMSYLIKPAVVEITNPSSGIAVSNVSAQVQAAREPFDLITYQLTDGLVTNTFSEMGVTYPLTNGLANPTRIRFLITPTYSNTVSGGTGLISVELRFGR